MKKIKIGLLLGIVAGIIDVIPMIMQNLTWDANISAFTMWIVVGFLIATIDLNINSIIKGILTAFLVLLPTAILIGWKEPVSLIPITIMTIFLGGLLGFSINKTLTKK
jgi:drug/metabolite transporter (DMT)-like permease